MTIKIEIPLNVKICLKKAKLFKRIFFDKRRNKII